MSCDYRRKKFLKEIVNSEPQLLRTMKCEGQPEVAVKMLDRIYQLGCAWPAFDEQARIRHKRAATSLLLEFQAKGLPLPTHAKVKPSEIIPLPKESAIDGYCKLYHILHILRTFNSCPPIVEKLVSEERTKAAKTAYLKASHKKGAGVRQKINVTDLGTKPEDMMTKDFGVPVFHKYKNGRGDDGYIRVWSKEKLETFLVMYRGTFTHFNSFEEAEDYLRQKMAELASLY